MNELIKIRQGSKTGRDYVDGRELHNFLESKRKFSDWIQQRIKKYQFFVNEDYVSFHKIVKREKGGTTIIEYALSVNMAKELSMIENNDQGRKARKYFIEAEKQRNLLVMNPSHMNKIELLELAIINEKQKLALQDKIRSDKPKVDLATVIEHSTGSIKIGDFAKVIQKDHGIDDIGQNRLFAFLKWRGYLMDNNKPYQKYMHYFELSETQINNPLYSGTSFTPRLTGKGQIKILKLVREEYTNYRIIKKPKVN